MVTPSKDADDVDDDVITLASDDGPCEHGNDMSPWQHSSLSMSFIYTFRCVH